MSVSKRSKEPTPEVAGRKSSGSSSPLGATCYSEGVNFSIFSKHATGVELLLFDSVDAARPARMIPL
ncbi:MAG TPA: hypothetical protein VLD57_09935, partial [Blastocatellia bacterium]|nr:hypothetical protein [Blastocatellia bacterium]